MIQNAEQNNDLKLKIDAHVIKQLGAELITSPLVAITEFVKNSHDAGATWCKVEIDPDYQEEIQVQEHLYPLSELIKRDDKYYKAFKGRIIITDNGCGMNRDTINKSWLTISFSEKRRKKEQGEKVEGGKRNYTGDKGLGRLGSMQVASICRITTATKEATDKEKVTINWDQIQEGITLDKIYIADKTLGKPSAAYQGSQIELIGLVDLNYWYGDLISFKYNLVVSISPFSFFEAKGDAFNLYIVIKGKEEKASELIKGFFDQNASWYQFSFDGKALRVEGKSILMAMESQNTRESFAKYVLPDKGTELFNYFFSKKEMAGYNITKSLDSKYFIEWHVIIDFEHIVIDRDISKSVVNPGDFNSEIYDFIYTKTVLGENYDLKFKENKDLIKDYLSGINLYRDGFKVGSGREDWLGFRSNKTDADGAYALRSANTSGYVNIASDLNPLLIDTSNREGLLNNDAYDIFQAICKRAIDEINKVRDKTRRTTLEFIAEKRNEDAKKPKQYSPQHAVLDLKAITSEADAVYSNLKEQKKQTDIQFTQSSSALQQQIKKSQTLFTDPDHIKILNQLNAELDQLRDIYQNLESKVLLSAQKLAVSERSVAAIEKQVEQYDTQITRFYGHVAIGLSAQFLAHDVNSQVFNISHQNKLIKERLKSLEIKDLTVGKSLMAIDGHTQALSKVTAALDPLMQAQQAEKHIVQLNDELTNYIDFVQPQLVEDKIIIVFNSHNAAKIKFNKGKLFQIIDNIVRNAQFWLNNFAKHSMVESKEIHIEIENDQITIWDTGRGFREGIEPSMFDMFVSDKPDGQGLGLFIVKNLLSERHCSVYVANDQNQYGNKYKLILDFSGAAL